MSNFVYPEWQLPPDYHKPPPPPDPETQVEINTRVDDALNRFMAASHKALYSEPDAYFRLQGRDAVDGLPAITGLLAELKKQTLAGVRSDLVRQPLQQRLAGRIELDEHDIDRHFRQQKKAWRRGVLDDRIELIRQRAGLIWNDRPSLQEHLDAAADLARSHAAVDGLAPDSEEAKARVRAASTGVLRAAIEGALDGNDSATALDLYERVKDRIAPGDAEVLARQIEDARRTDTGRAWIDQFIATLPDRPQEIDEAHRAAVGRILVDWPEDPEMQAAVRHLLDVAFDDHRHRITQRRADLEKQIEEWFEQRLPDGRRQNRRPPRALWTQLDPDQRQQVYERLKINTGAVASPDREEIPRPWSPDSPAGRDPNIVLAGSPPGDDEAARKWQRRKNPSDIEKPRILEMTPPLGTLGGGARLPSVSKGPSSRPSGNEAASRGTRDARSSVEQPKPIESASPATGRTLTRAEQLEVNKAAGRVFENAFIDELREQKLEVGGQITLRSGLFHQRSIRVASAAASAASRSSSRL